MFPPISSYDDFQSYVRSAAFDQVCAERDRINMLSRNNDTDCSYDTVDTEPLSSGDTSPYDIPEYEAYMYYFGIRDQRRQGPKLIFRTSKDVFTEPFEPEAYARCMRLLPVYKHDKLGKDGLWDTIRLKVVELLDRRNIRHSSVDLARFSWDEEIKPDEISNDEPEESSDGQESDDDQEGFDIEEYDKTAIVAPYRPVVTTPITIWVGVLPDTLSAEVAYHSSNDILSLLKEHDISDIEVAYRESVARGFSGPELLAPVLGFDPLKSVIDPVTTAIGLPIAGLKTLARQGTMGFYFGVGEDIYAVTARHILFPEDEGNDAYYYTTGPKKKVVLMGTKAFADFLASIQCRIANSNCEVDILERRVAELMARLDGGHPQAEQAELKQAEIQIKLNETRAAIDKLKTLFVEMRIQWTNPKDRIIGHVVWAPPVSVSPAPHNYTKDLCVIKLDKEKFLRNFRGNVLDLGPDEEAAELTRLMRPYFNAPSDLGYLIGRLFKLRGISSAEEMRTPNNDPKGDSTRYVVKHGLATQTTIGYLNGFESHIRCYFDLGARDSVETAIYSYGSEPRPFSKAGDSGSVIVDVHGKAVALLTSGTGPAYTPDVAYGSPMHWLWEIIEAQFPGANLYFPEYDNSDY